MYTLYARPGSGSAAVEALLAELNLPHDIVDIPRGSDLRTTPSFLAINPRGEIPALRMLDDSVMTESAAIMIYLADLNLAAGFAPALDKPARAQYLRWMLYFASAVYMADLRYFYPTRYSTDEAHAEAIKTKAHEHMDRDFAIFAKELGKGPYILGEAISAVDIYAAMLVGWAPDVEAVFARHPNIKALFKAVAARPKITPIWVRNNMPL